MKPPHHDQHGSRVRAYFFCLLCLGCGLLVACECDSGTVGGKTRDLGGGGEQLPDFTWTNDGSSADGEVCAQSSVSAMLEVKPIDIIIFIDNSGSMSAEIKEVEEQINANFASIINAAKPAIDYRVILLSQFGSYGNNSICVAEPLGGIADANNDGHCDTVPAQPVNTARFYHHSRSISSHDGLCQVISQLTRADTYNLQPNGYGEILRPEAFKFILAVTDDGVRCGSYNDGNSVSGGWAAAQAFDADLLANFPEHFGKSPEERNYTFWSIVSLKPYLPTASKPYGEPHPPDADLAPVTTAECTPSAADPGTGYQALSIMTGGYRYPTCGLEYTEIFQLMAKGVILGARVACEYLIPEPPEGETLALDTVQVRYSSDGQEVEVFNPTATRASCTEDKHQFYFEGDYLKLCPSTCELVQADEKASIDVLYGCTLNIQID